jgi:predicted O-methyltransferase YrrM
MEIDEVKKVVDHCTNPIFVENGLIQQVKEEFTLLAYFLKAFKPHNVLEIGCKSGSFFMFNQFSTGKKVAVDINDQYLKYLLFYTHNDDFAFLKANSQTNDTLEAVRSLCGQFDFIFIDGDHSYEGVKKDFELYKQLLSPRGYIGFHDIDSNHIYKDYSDGAGQVYKFWQELSYGSKTEIICQKSSSHNRLLSNKFAWGPKEHFGGIGLWQP